MFQQKLMSNRDVLGKLNMKNIILFLGEKALATCRKKNLP